MSVRNTLFGIWGREFSERVLDRAMVYAPEPSADLILAVAIKLLREENEALKKQSEEPVPAEIRDPNYLHIDRDKAVEQNIEAIRGMVRPGNVEKREVLCHVCGETRSNCGRS